MPAEHMAAERMEDEPAQKTRIANKAMAVSLSRRLLLAVSIMAIAGGAVSLVWRRTHTTAAATPCHARGAIDTPKIADTGQAGISVQGWAADAAGLNHVELRADGKLLASVKPGIARADVVAALPQCKLPLDSGHALSGNA